MDHFTKKELLEQCVEFLDNLENDDYSIPKNVWTNRNRLLHRAKNLGFKIYNEPKEPHFTLTKDYEDHELKGNNSHL